MYYRLWASIGIQVQSLRLKRCVEIVEWCLNRCGAPEPRFVENVKQGYQKILILSSFISPKRRRPTKQKQQCRGAGTNLVQQTVRVFYIAPSVVFHWVAYNTRQYTFGINAPFGGSDPTASTTNSHSQTISDHPPLCSIQVTHTSLSEQLIKQKEVISSLTQFDCFFPIGSCLKILYHAVKIQKITMLIPVRYINQECYNKSYFPRVLLSGWKLPILLCLQWISYSPAFQQWLQCASWWDDSKYSRLGLRKNPNFHREKSPTLSLDRAGSKRLKANSRCLVFYLFLSQQFG